MIIKNNSIKASDNKKWFYKIQISNW